MRLSLFTSLGLIILIIAGGGCLPDTPALSEARPVAVTATATTMPSALADHPPAPVTGVSTATMLVTLSPEPSPASSATSTPSATPTPLACWQAGGRYEHASLRNNRLPLPLEYAVYLPPCYDEQPGRRYPVLYLIHGQNYNHDQWDRLGVDEQADRLIGAGEVSPFIIVLPRDRSWAQPTEDAFGQVLAEELVPEIDARYRTLAERQNRAIGGLSRGAGWAVHLGLSRWDLFGAIGGHSLPVFWTDTTHIRSWLQAIPADDLPRIYLDIGDKDRPAILQSAQWFAGVLDEYAIPHEWYLFRGYHEEAYWAEHLPQYLRWYAATW